MTAALPFIDLKAQYERLKPAIRQRIDQVLEHGAFIMGPEIAELEAALATYCGARHAISMSSGTDALLAVLLADGVGPGDAVYLPSFTFTATAEVVALLGATPVFVDVSPRLFNIDVEDLERRVQATPPHLKPRCVIAVDLFGWPADYPAVAAVAERYGMRVLADAAQSFGASLNGRRVGGLAWATATSFFPAKPLGGYGDGGAVFTDDDELAAKLRSVRVHGQGAAKYDVARIGLNARLDTLQAAILLPKLEIFPQELAAREAAAQMYDRLLADHVATPARRDGATSAWAQYTVLVEPRDGQAERRDAVAAAMKAAGAPTAVYYPRPMHQQPAYAAYADKASPLPVAERLCQQVLSLPMHPYLSEADIGRVAAALIAAVAN